MDVAISNEYKKMKRDLKYAYGFSFNTIDRLHCESKKQIDYAIFINPTLREFDLLVNSCEKLLNYGVFIVSLTWIADESLLTTNSRKKTEDGKKTTENMEKNKAMYANLETELLNLNDNTDGEDSDEINDNDDDNFHSSFATNSNAN